MNLTRRGMIYEQRDIVLIPFPYSDLTGSKKLPALIISNSNINNTDYRICCLITRNSRKGDLEIKNSDFENGKLPFKSFVRAQRIFTIDAGIVIKKLCKIKPEFHDRVIEQV